MAYPNHPRRVKVCFYQRFETNLAFSGPFSCSLVAGAFYQLLFGNLWVASKTVFLTTTSGISTSAHRGES